MRQKYMLINLNIKGVNGMLITTKLIKFRNMLIKIPKQTGNVWDLSENRWGYKFLSKKK
tara:strand:- start:514 stop:690 length:177 start_codon:yes stop_codon:yes gene_type:complete